MVLYFFTYTLCVNIKRLIVTYLYYSFNDKMINKNVKLIKEL